MVAPHRRVEAPVLARRRELLRYLECSFPEALEGSGSPSQPQLAADPALTAFAQLGALRLGAKSCLISLLSRERQYVIAESTQSVSLRDCSIHKPDGALMFGVRSFTLDVSFCAWTLAHALQEEDSDMSSLDFYTQPEAADVFVVKDLSQDERFKDFDIVKGSPHLRFYAGVPLISPQTGRGIGSLCVLDDQARQGVDPIDVTALKDIAATVMDHLEHARATLERGRSDKMVRGIGAFVEGESSISDWWERTRPHISKSIPQARATADYFANSTSVGQDPTMGSDNLAKPKSVVVRKPSSSSAESDNDSDAKGSTQQTGLSTLNTRRKAREKKQHKADVKTEARENEQRNADPATFGIKSLVSRASNIIREGAELDGIMFLDARMASLRTGRTISHVPRPRGDDAEGETSPSSNGDDPNRPCRVLGFSSNESLHEDEVSPATSLALFPEKTLRYLLRRYPRGRILHLDDISSASESERSSSALAGGGAVETSDREVPNPHDVGPRKKTTVKISRANEAAIMSMTFPGARSVAFLPLFDSSKERWFGAAFAYTCSSLRELTVEGELSYLAAFGNSLMAEVSRVEAVKADEAKANFIGAISHELRSPLHGILGSAEMLKDSNLDSLQADLLHNVQVCGRTLLDTVDHLLDFSKMNNLLRPRTSGERESLDAVSGTIASKTTAQSMGLHKVNLDIGIVCEEVMQTVSSGHSKNEIGTGPTEDPFSDSVALILEIDEPSACLFQSQPGALKRIVSNLISNGQKYTTSGFVRLRIEAKSMIPAENDDPPDEDSATVSIIVDDTGKGMSKNYLRDRLYTPFAQENSHAPGTGLGLSIVRQIVTSLHGTITVESEKNKGTTVRISLPMKAPVKNTASTTQVERSEITAARHLVSGKSVAIIGFDPRAGEDALAPVPSTWSPTDRGSAFLGKSIASFCETSIGLKVHRHPSLANLGLAADIHILDLASAVASSYDLSGSSTPAVVICPSAASAAHWTRVKARTAGNAPIYYAAQPLGPLRMAKMMSSIFRDADPTSASGSLTDTWSWDYPSPGLSLASRPFELSRQSRHSGSIEYISRSAQGGTPPIPSSTPKRAEEAAQDTSNLPHVLLVDDNAINLRLLETFCRKLTIQYASASNGVQALEAFKAAMMVGKPFKFVLMDINMPVMDGLESSREIRKFEREQDPKLERHGSGDLLEKRRAVIIALTGLNSVASQQEAFASGMDLFLTKPVKFAELKELLMSEGGVERKSSVSAKAELASGDVEKSGDDIVMKDEVDTATKGGSESTTATAPANDVDDGIPSKRRRISEDNGNDFAT